MNETVEAAALESEIHRDANLDVLVSGIPYVRFLGMRFERKGDELTSVLPFRGILLGNPDPPALHGGAIAAFLEVTALVELSWRRICDGGDEAMVEENLRKNPKTIALTADYLRPGYPRAAYARAHIVRSGRRYATVRVEAWQEKRSRNFAQATGHFLMPA